MTKEEKSALISKLYREMYIEIFQFVIGYCRDKHLTEEVVQEVFYEAWRHAEKLKVHENRRGWVYNTAKYKVKQSLAKRARLRANEEPIGDLLDTFSVEDTYEFLALDEFSHMVSKEQMELLKSRYQEKNTYVEMAEDFGSSEGACKMVVSRIRRRIRELMKKSESRDNENDGKEK